MKNINKRASSLLGPSRLVVHFFFFCFSLRRAYYSLRGKGFFFFCFNPFFSNAPSLSPSVGAPPWRSPGPLGRWPGAGTGSLRTFLVRMKICPSFERESALASLALFFSVVVAPAPLARHARMSHSRLESLLVAERVFPRGRTTRLDLSSRLRLREA